MAAFFIDTLRRGWPGLDGVSGNLEDDIFRLFSISRVSLFYALFLSISTRVREREKELDRLSDVLYACCVVLCIACTARTVPYIFSFLLLLFSILVSFIIIFSLYSSGVCGIMELTKAIRTLQQTTLFWEWPFFPLYLSLSQQEIATAVLICFFTCCLVFFFFSLYHIFLLLFLVLYTFVDFLFALILYLKKKRHFICLLQGLFFLVFVSCWLKVFQYTKRYII